MDWILYDTDLRHERVNNILHVAELILKISKKVETPGRWTKTNGIQN